jgi:hypothetical protein
MTTMTTDTNPIPQPFLDAAAQAGLQLARTRDGVLELSNNAGQGMLFTADFEHEIPMWCADHGAKFKKRFQRDDDIESEVEAEPEPEETDDDEDGEVDVADNRPVAIHSRAVAGAIEDLMGVLMDEVDGLSARIDELEVDVELLKRKLKE